MASELSNILKVKQKEIADKWLKLIFDEYPETGAKFISENSNKFHNPVGFTISEEIPLILGEIIEPKDLEILSKSLENIIKIRAVQDFQPSEAVGFIFKLKQIIRHEFYHLNESDRHPRDIFDIESKIDQVASLGFDMYMRKKEKIFDIKANEVKDRFGKVVDRLNKKYDGKEL